MPTTKPFVEAATRFLPLTLKAGQSACSEIWLRDKPQIEDEAPWPSQDSNLKT